MNQVTPSEQKQIVGTFGKKSIGSFVDTRCQRQLYLNLGNHDSRWLQSPDTIRIRSGYSAPANTLMDSGKFFERSIYAVLLETIPKDIKHQAINALGEIAQTKLSAHAFQNLHTELQNHSTAKLLLLEHQWPLTAHFVQEIFQSPLEIPTLGNTPSPDKPDGRSIRPDLMIIHRCEADGDIFELCANGDLRAVPLSDRATRFAINIIDIKHTPQDNIGHRHFSEILFYARSLAMLLEEWNLQSKFFVHANGNGILGNIDANELRKDTWRKLLWTPNASNPTTNSLLVYEPFMWRNVRTLWDDFEESVQALWKERETRYQRDHTHVPLRIQPACGRCPYVDDCIQSLTGCENEINLRDPNLQTAKWNIEVIPGIKPALVHELQLQGIFTLEDLVNKIDLIDFNNQISPLYAEKETLRMKAEALTTLRPAVPKDPTLFNSALLPHSINMALILNLETEQPNNLVFGYGLQLSIVPPISQFSFALNQIHVKWWNAWVQTLATIDFEDFDGFEELNEDFFKTVDLSPVRNALDMEAFVTHHMRGFKPSKSAKTDAEKEAEREAQRNIFQERFTLLTERLLPDMLKGLIFLKMNESLKRKAHLGLQNSSVDVTYTYTELCENLETNSEYALLKSLIEQLYHILNLCHCTEMLVIGQSNHNGSVRTYTHNFAGFYWSPQQIEHLFSLVGRHYTRMTAEACNRRSRTLAYFERVQDFINPSNSNIRHSQHHKKLYDIQAFLKQGIAFPEIISYSWHDLLTLWDPTFKVDRRYWAPLFNFMDFTVWTEMRNTESMKKRTKIYEKICQQMLVKITGIQRILLSIHQQARSEKIIPSEAQTIDTEQYIESSFTRREYNTLARLWVGLHELNVSTAEMEHDIQRLTWPNFSIAKLKGAKIERLRCLPDVDSQTNSTLEFFIPEMSSNVKCDVGSTVQLLNLEHRNKSTHWKIHKYGSSLCITEKVWTSLPDGQVGFRVEGEMTDPHSGFVGKASMYSNHTLWSQESPPPDEAIFARLDSKWDGTRHLYLTTSDPWTTPMHSLLNRYNLGFSELAEIVAFKSGLRTTYTPLQSNWMVGAPEVYLYAPNLLPTLPNHMNAPIQTQIFPPPDASQQQAIRTTLSHPITCIQGPPGTGKSQTVVALIDDFLHRHGKNPRVLVTAFSYSALFVVAEKILETYTGTEDNPQEGIPRVGKTTLILSGDRSRYTGIKCNHDDQPAPIFLRGRNSEWHATTSLADDVEESKIGSGTKKKLLGNLLDAFDRNEEDGFILFANAYTLRHIGAPYTGKAKTRPKFACLPDDFGFDLIIIDEASQMPTNYLTSVAQLVKPFQSPLHVPSPLPLEGIDKLCLETPPNPADLTRLVLVGDHNQLPPISPIEPPEKLKHLIDSAFYYYLKTHLADSPPAEVALEYNYRSHADIVTCIQKLGLYNNLYPYKGHHSNLQKIKESLPSSITAPWLQSLLKREHVVNTLLHNSPLDTVFSKTEAQLTIEVILAFLSLQAPQDASAEVDFWDKELGVVSPHNAHGSLIIRGVQQALTNPNNRRTHLTDEQLQEKLQGCVASVDKFQGSARNFIIGTMGISAEDQLIAEETFFYDINRFNVLISRAKSKMLLICSRNFARYTPSDKSLMSVAAKIREYVFEVCTGDGTLYSTGEAQDAIQFELRTMPSTTTQSSI